MKKETAKKEAGLDHKLLQYGAMAGVVAGGVSATEAAIITGDVNQPVSTGASFQIDLNGDAVNDFNFNFNTSPSGYPFPASGNIIGLGGNAVLAQRDGFFAANLTTSQSVSPSVSFRSNGAIVVESSSMLYGAFTGGSGYLGVRFDISGSTHYGWLQVDGVSDTGYTVVDYGFEDVADTAIPVDAIPEPASLTLLAAGAAGIYGVRRKLAI